ncbi:heme-dependent oxidative N-demethylase subunit alpha family protein [Caenimonas aquaedulcis]|uniref:DUF3445 domain-containing protein n=1 Tax=Caenimonas aquaedulcis TaxID=2793270 RepID=A0A931H2E9_9BURK|nr:heme-dependent oxidative N-demethylase subunit alpha family protein [Caenimonas aquaedulcis]MBG9387337.1 DUF3445 domain-containing protein [Caenimonas aquaedulcis]
MFDFNRIAVPFRMQPGLQRVDGPSLRLTPLDPAGHLHAEKLAVVQAGRSRLLVPGFDPLPALRAIASRAGIDADPTSFQPELHFEEDFAVLDGATATLPFLCVCVPSHWAPEEKLGLDFATLHAPVADNAALVAASRQLVALATNGDCWERFVWTISPSDRYDQHPGRHAREPWPETPDAAEFARRCWLRTERQVFFPVGQGTRQAVFTIRVTLEPLVQAVGNAQRAARLHDSLASMSEAVLHYKGLAPARERLLRWLAGAR